MALKSLLTIAAVLSVAGIISPWPWVLSVRNHGQESQRASYTVIIISLRNCCGHLFDMPVSLHGVLQSEEQALRELAGVWWYWISA